MKCPIARYECRLVEVRLSDYPMVAYQCVEHGEVVYWLLSPEAVAQFEAEWKEARAIIAAAKGSEDYGIGG